MLRSIRYSIVILLSLTSTLQAQKQLEEEPELLISLFKNLYSFHFQDAEENLIAIQSESISLDLKDICTANYHWWIIATQEENSENKKVMLAVLDRIITRYNETPPADLNPDEIFAIVHALAYKTRLDMQEKNYFEGARNLSQAVKYLEIVLPRAEENEKFMLLAGLYHYVAGSILEKYPLFQPLFLMAPKTDMEKGYKFLQRCAEMEHPLISNEARYFIMKVQTQINEKYFEADMIAKQLLQKFPDNQYYRSYRIRILAETGNIKETRLEYERLCKLQPHEQLSIAQHSFLVADTKKYLRKKRIKFQY